MKERDRKERDREERDIYILVVIVPLHFFPELRVQVPATRHPWMGQDDRQFCYTAKTPARIIKGAELLT
jgi:hypothetical protein